jgi:hypothetical protein
MHFSEAHGTMAQEMTAMRTVSRARAGQEVRKMSRSLLPQGGSAKFMYLA